MRGLVFSLDDNYLMPFRVLWYSLMETDSVASKTPVFILYDKTLSKKSIEEITEVITQSGFQSSFLSTSSLIPDNLPISEKDHLSKATFYRLYIGSILPQEITSVVYLDSDAVVIRSIQDLFEIELTNPIAAVDHLSPEDQIRLWGENSGNYFQAGVLVIDLVSWRSLNIEGKFSTILNDERHRIRWWDQCVLNIAFENNWQRLPFRFNFFYVASEIIDFDSSKNLISYIHFDGTDKPWKTFSKSAVARYWYDTYEDLFGYAFDLKSIKPPVWNQIKLNIKRMLKNVL